MTHATKHLSHFNTQGQAHMVDIGAKDETHRVAQACGSIVMLAETLAVIQSGGTKKGDVLLVARIAAIQATKKTADLIPLCHPIQLTAVEVNFRIDPDACAVHCTVRTECRGQTGVEMEALTGCQIGLLTIYDMCKAIDRGMTISNVHLESKSGGKSGDWVAPGRLAGHAGDAT